jgi:hypothetical protein
MVCWYHGVENGKTMEGPLSRPFISLLNHTYFTSGTVVKQLRTHGYAVVDNAFGKEWANKIKNDIQFMFTQKKMHLNATHFVDSTNSVSLLEKKHIWEKSSEELITRDKFDDLTSSLNKVLADSQTDLCGKLFASDMDISHCTVKIQYNAGLGGCFPVSK